MQFDAAAKLEARKSVTGRPLYSTMGSIAVIPIRGVLTDDWSPFGPYWGQTGYNYVSGAIRQARKDSTVDAIVLNINSPGGTVTDLPELAAEIFSGSQRKKSGGKPVVASISGLGASAAYWIASAADFVTLSPSGEAGSIGVWTAHIDQSGFWRMIGMDMKLISSGKHKVEGNPYEPLPDNVRDQWQAGVDDLRQQFSASVAENRGMDVKDILATEAAIYPATSATGRKTALEVGIIDAVAPVDQTISTVKRLYRR